MSVFTAYLITFGWAIVGSIGMGLGIIIALKLFDLSTPRLDEWEEIKKGNIAMAVVLAAIVLAVGIVIAAAVRPLILKDAVGASQRWEDAKGSRFLA